MKYTLVETKTMSCVLFNPYMIISQNRTCSFMIQHNICNSVQWASYQIRKIACCACARNAGNVFPRRRLQGKPLVSDHGMHHGTCVTHVPWYMSGSLTCGGGENVPGIPGACAPAISRICQEAHWQSRLHQLGTWERLETDRMWTKTCV